MVAVQSATDVALAGAFGHLSVGAVAAVQPVPMEVDSVVAGALGRTAVPSSGGAMAVTSVSGVGPGISPVGGPVPMEDGEVMDLS